MWVNTGDILFNLDTGCSVCIDAVKIGKSENFYLTWKDKTGESEFVIVVTETSETANRVLQQLSTHLEAWSSDHVEVL